MSAQTLHENLKPGAVVELTNGTVVTVEGPMFAGSATKDASLYSATMVTPGDAALESMTALVPDPVLAISKKNLLAGRTVHSA